MEENPNPRDPTGVPYKPFPTFSEWRNVDVSLSTSDAYFNRIAKIKSEASSSQLEDAVRIATKWAAVDTGAIEGLYEVDRGFTYSVARSATAWSNIHKEKNEYAARSIADAMKAYEWVIDAATNNSLISEKWIKELHAELCASQDTYTVITDRGVEQRELPKGQYKTLPNNPINHASNEVHCYAAPIDTQPEMTRFINELRSVEFNSSHPILQASYTHYAFVSVHPFPDGNGRVARTLASVFLYRNPGIPLVVFANQKSEYFDSLERADKGETIDFVRFILERALDTIGMVEAQMQSAALPDVVEQQNAMRAILRGRGGLQHTLVDDIANRLLDLFRQSLVDQGSENPLTPPLSNQFFGTNEVPRTIPTDYRMVISNPKSIGLQIRSDSPAAGSLNHVYGVAVARQGIETADFILVCEERVVLEIFLREIYPEIKDSLSFKMMALARAEFRIMVQEVQRQAAVSLEKNGYVG
ncbi:MAG TPA: Fic family protein [Candidatus Paceibacterota bacterium]|nr:Fic family protein [Candidatus Paceibacterota bacterium]